MVFADLVAQFLPVGTGVVVLALALWHGRTIVKLLGSLGRVARVLLFVGVIIGAATVAGVIDVDLAALGDLVTGPAMDLLTQLLEIAV